MSRPWYGCRIIAHVTFWGACNNEKQSSKFKIIDSDVMNDSSDKKGSVLKMIEKNDLYSFYGRSWFARAFIKRLAKSGA